jgi:endonuclease/exonuclease/phosphatase family metal-dependent hydrolase
MKNSLWLVVCLYFIFCSCGTSDTDDTNSDQFQIVTFNAGLALGFVDYTRERAPLVPGALNDLATDLICVQEIWQTEHVQAVIEGTKESFENTFFLDPLPDEDVTEPACTVEELTPLEECVNLHCADTPVDQLASCALASCSVEFGNISSECQGCLGSNIGQSMEIMLANCTQAGGAYAYGGSFGIGLLSKMPLDDQDHLVLDSKLNRRAVIYAKLDTPALGQVHVFCTHLSSVFTKIPYPDEQGSWEEEQANQIQALSTFIADKTDNDSKVILLGDMNTGPTGDGFSGEIPDNYDLIMATMDSNPYLENTPECTYCHDNPLVGEVDHESSVLIDHILLRDIPNQTEAVRILDSQVDILVNDQNVTTSLSDHYGLKVSVQSNH